MVNLTYQGCFKLPILSGVTYRQFTFNSACFPMAYRPSTGTLVLRGHPQNHDFAEINIPSNLSGSTRAAVIGNWFDPTVGKLQALNTQYAGSQGIFHRGCFIDQNDVMHGLVNMYYNVANQAPATYFHYDFTTKQSTNFVNTLNHPLKTSGYICELSTELKTFYNKDIGLAETIPQNTSGTNNGPALFVSNLATPNDIAKITWTKTNPYRYSTALRAWDGACRIDGMVDFPDALAWFGRTPTADALVWYDHDYTYVSPGVVIKDGVTYSDPCSRAKGYHASAMRPVMFYIEHSDLKNNNIVIKEMALPWINKSPCCVITSAIDKVNGRLFIMESAGDGTLPLIHVFNFTTENDQMLQEQINALNATIATLQGVIAELQAEENEHQAMIADLNNQIAALQATNTTSAASITTLNAQINDLNNQIAALQATNAVDAATIVTLNAKVADLQDKITRIGVIVTEPLLS